MNSSSWGLVGGKWHRRRIMATTLVTSPQKCAPFHSKLALFDCALGGQVSQSKAGGENNALMMGKNGNWTVTIPGHYEDPLVKRTYLLWSECCQLWYCPVTLLLAVWEAIVPCHIHGIHIGDRPSCKETKPRELIIFIFDIDGFIVKALCMLQWSRGSL